MSIQAKTYPASSNMYALHGTAAQWYWWLWVLALSVISVVFLATMDIGPYMHSDEFVILDMGRTILDPKTNWSIAWLADQEQPVYLISYLGNVMQELSFEFGGQYSPRVSALIGALAAATALVGLLVARGTLIWPAFWLGLVFLFDPLFVQSFTIGRIDSWTMALCLSSCWILRGNQDHDFKGKAFSARLLLAGALACIAFFTWPSAVFLFPLIALELLNVLGQGSIHRAIQKDNLKPVLLFVAGGGIAMLFLLAPIASQLPAQFSNALASFKANAHSGSSGEERAVFQNYLGLLRVLKFSPFIVILAVVAAIKVKQPLLVIAFGAVTALMVFTLVYINRVQYLIPYFAVCISYLYTKDNADSSNRLLRIGGIAILLFWSIGMSLGVRTFLAFDAPAHRDRNLVYQAALSLVGPGNHRVYIPYDMYYAGRKLGWQMYRAYLAYNNPLTFEVLNKVLPYVDYVIMIQYQVTEEVENGLLAEGWHDAGVLALYSEPAEPFTGVTTNEIRVRNLYSIFEKPYGPYRLFVREKGQATPVNE
ncbi:hypothetical protein [Pontibacter roseus]|uniref:hypothetical protein n=1 Tax=Pontibacter roseus TaxID=336989 RepID=UPI0003A3C41F|nr:hypothetical protein [Pontibacter roseus]